MKRQIARQSMSAAPGAERKPLGSVCAELRDRTRVPNPREPDPPSCALEPVLPVYENPSVAPEAGIDACIRRAHKTNWSARPSGLSACSILNQFVERQPSGAGGPHDMRGGIVVCLRAPGSVASGYRARPTRIGAH